LLNFQEHLYSYIHEEPDKIATCSHMSPTTIETGVM
jgi:hypothetical protein